MINPDQLSTTDRLWKALNSLLRECQWTREGSGYLVERRSGNIGIAQMLQEAEEAHSAYIRERE